MTNAVRAVLQNSHLLRMLDAEGLDRVATLAVRRSYQPGMRIFSVGDPGDAIYGVISGEVHITARTSSDQEIFLDVVSANEVFGEIAVVDGLSRLANAQAATDVEVYLICTGNFRRLMLIEPKIALGLLHVLCRHQRFSTQLIIDEYAQGNISARLAHRVLQLTGANDSTSISNRPLTITQAELAKFVFVSRQVVNQHLSEWQSRGWISTSRGRLLVNDRDALVAVARSNGTGRSNGRSNDRHQPPRSLVSTLGDQYEAFFNQRVHGNA